MTIAISSFCTRVSLKAKGGHTVWPREVLQALCPSLSDCQLGGHRSQDEMTGESTTSLSRAWCRWVLDTEVGRGVAVVKCWLYISAHRPVPFPGLQCEEAIEV